MSACGAKQTWAGAPQMSASLLGVVKHGPSAPKLTILRAISDGFTACPHTLPRFSSFVFIAALSPCRKRGSGDFARRETIDETVSHWRSVYSLDRLQLPLASARGGATVHLTGLLHQNCSHHAD